MRGHACKDRSPCRTSQAARVLRRELPVRALREVEQWVWVAGPAKDVETRRLWLRTAAGIKTGRSRHGLHVQIQNPARGRGRGNGERITPGHSNCVSAEWSSGGQARVQEAADDPGCATAVGIDTKRKRLSYQVTAARRGATEGLTHLAPASSS